MFLEAKAVTDLHASPGTLQTRYYRWTEQQRMTPSLSRMLQEGVSGRGSRIRHGLPIPPSLPPAHLDQG